MPEPAETLELLAKLVAIPSLSGQESAAADFVQGWLDSAGLGPRRWGNNLICEIGDGRPRLLVNSHIDTVPPSSGWSADPFAPRIEAGQLIGLGANDAKGCSVALMLAAREWASGGTGPGTLVLAITAEEETGGPGGITSILPQLGALDAAIIGEPTGLAPCIAQRGMLLLSCEAVGQSGHVAHAAGLGLANAIHLAAHDIAVLEGMQFGRHPLLGECRAQVTLIEGGIGANQVPDRCRFTVDLRTLPEMQHPALAADIASKLRSRVSIRSERYLPVSTPEGHPISQACFRACGKAPIGSATVSDWSLLGPMPAVKIGPGESSRSHRPDEYVTELELAQAVRVYTAAVREYFLEAGRG